VCDINDSETRLCLSRNTVSTSAETLRFHRSFYALASIYCRG